MRPHIRCLPSKSSKIFLHERSEFLNCAAIFTTKKSKGSCTIHQLKKVMYKCALALFFARNINFEKVMCKCALFLKRGLEIFKSSHYSVFLFTDLMTAFLKKLSFIIRYFLNDIDIECQPHSRLHFRTIYRNGAFHH